jgi:F-type H+-transporting ATPase subunit delta
MSDTNTTEQHGDVGVERVARVYAEALLNPAEQQGQVDAVRGDLDALIDDVFKGDPRLEALLGGSAVGRNARRDAIERAFAGRVSDLFLNFLLVLNDHERLALLRSIRAAFHELYNKRARRVKVQVYSAVPLSDEQRARLEAGVRQRFGLEPILVTHVDPRLLGGLRVRVGDTQIDATVRARLDNLRNQILARQI